MTEEESVELARIVNRIIAEKLGAAEGTEYVRPSPELISLSVNLPKDSTTQEVAENLAKQLLAILSPD